MCLKIVGVDWKERDGDGSEDLNEGEEGFFLYESFVYIGRC